jgi:membrane-bound inhibitor of C-type lysozyme
MRNHPLLRVLTGLAGLLAASAFAQGSAPTPPAPQPLMFSSQTVQYKCDGGAEIELVYLNLANGNAFAALHHQDRTVMLQGRRATTGVRFVALDERHSLRWYTQGMKGELSLQPPGQAAQEQTLLANCFAQPAKR